VGLTFLNLKVANPNNPLLAETVEFFIDSGAIYSVVPRPVLQRIGVNPVSKQVFRLASRQTVEREMGVALFTYQDRVGGATVIFGEESDSNLLGAHTLEAFGLSLDPLRRELVPLPMILAFLPATSEP
jgi:aspartyl protease family protein